MKKVHEYLRENRIKQKKKGKKWEDTKKKRNQLTRKRSQLARPRAGGLTHNSRNGSGSVYQRCVTTCARVGSL
jgi:hypothetical protein